MGTVRINQFGDATICMVVGCAKKALYRNPNSKGAHRGYCRLHKALAMGRVYEYQIASFDEWLHGQGRAE